MKIISALSTFLFGILYVNAEFKIISGSTHYLYRQQLFANLFSFSLSILIVCLLIDYAINEHENKYHKQPILNKQPNKQFKPVLDTPSKEDNEINFLKNSIKIKYESSDIQKLTKFINDNFTLSSLEQKNFIEQLNDSSKSSNVSMIIYNLIDIIKERQ